MNEKLVDVELSIDFCVVHKNNKKSINQEFDKLSEHNQDPLSNWLKIAKAKGDIAGDDILLHLIVELHRKLEKIENILENKSKTYLPLEHKTKVISIGHNHFRLLSKDVTSDNMYGRIDMPIFPTRAICIFFSHIKENIYKIDLMHNRDTIDYDSYIRARERALIREKRGYIE
jgi:hypothetical protein